MNLKMKSAALMMLCILATSCGKKSEKQELAAALNTPALSFNFEGTYTGVTRAADCPGIYVMLALDSARFEVMNKYLDRQGIYIDKGTFNIYNDTLMIDNIPYRIGENILYNSTDTLYKLNEEKMLPTAIKQQILIENAKDNKEAVLQEYFSEDKRVAILNFLGKEYTLYSNDENTQEAEYTDGKNSLVMEIIDPAPTGPTTPIFSDGTNNYEFTITSPLNYIYTSTDAPFFDVVYCNDENSHFVMLLTDDIKECYILPQTTAWAKGAEYSNKDVTWISTHSKAEFTKGDKRFKYVENELTK